MFIRSMRGSTGGVVWMYGKTRNAEASFCWGGAPSAVSNAICPSLPAVGIGVEVGRGVAVNVAGRGLVAVRVAGAGRVAGGGRGRTRVAGSVRGCGGRRVPRRARAGGARGG